VLVDGCWLLAVGCQLSVVKCQEEVLSRVKDQGSSMDIVVWLFVRKENLRERPFFSQHTFFILHSSLGYF